MELLSPGHLIPLLIIAGLLFFGWKQLPDMARSAGRSLRIFRTEIKGLADDDAIREARSTLTAPLGTDTHTDTAVPSSPVAPTGSWVWTGPGPQPAVAPVAPSASAEATMPDASAKPAG